MHIHGLARVEEQGRGLLVGQITARVRLSGIELQTRQLGHDQPSGVVLWIKCKPRAQKSLSKPNWRCWAGPDTAQGNGQNHGGESLVLPGCADDRSASGSQSIQNPSLSD